MVDGKPKATKFFQRPREQLSLREQPGLEGHVGSDELHEFLMPHLFGIGFPRKNLLPLPYTLDGNEELVLALATGMGQIAVERILDELKNGTLTLYASELTNNETWGTRHRVPASVFDSLTAFEVKTELLLGGAHGPLSAFPDWTWGKQFFFEADEVETWFESLEPVAMLPKVVERDSTLLPLGPISASAAICWVAGQKIRDWYELIEAGGQIREALQTLNTPADAVSVAERSSAARVMVALLAERHVRSHAANEIIRLMGEGRLTGYGVPDHRNSNAAQSVFEEIPETAFLIQREFSSNGKFTDCLVAAATGDIIEDQQASNEFDWTHVRYESHDLIGIWGHATAAIDETAPTTTVFDGKKSNTPRGRRAKYDWVGLYSHLDELWNYHGPLAEADPDWGRQADVEEAAMEWFINEIDDHPASSTIRERVSHWVANKKSETGNGQ